MKDSEIIEEMLFNSKWLSKEYKDSKVYREYLDKCNQELKKSSYNR